MEKKKNNNLTLTHVHPIAKSISNHTFHWLFVKIFTMEKKKNNNLTLTHVHPIAKSISNHTFH